MNGETRALIFPMHAQVPIAMFLISVGNNSEVYMNVTEKEIVTKPLAITEKIV